MHRMGIDTGGTFTDVTYVSPTGEVETLKTPSTDDLLSGVRTGFDRMLDVAGVDASSLGSLAHGSTVAVNTVIERDGATTGAVTNEGFRDRLEIGQIYRSPELVYNPKLAKSDPLVKRRHRFEVGTRRAGDGSVVDELDESDVDALVEAVRDSDVDSVAVCLLHSYLAPETERRIGDALRDRTDCTVSVSSDLSREIGEYERLSTGVVDAYVKPRVGEYLRDLRARFDDTGLSVPVHVMRSEGGLARSSSVAERPVSALLSGPIAGIIAAQYYGNRAGVSDLVTFDMGGTSCDASLVVDGEPTEDTVRDVEDLPVKGPFTTLETVGAGGGSIAHVDDGVLRVGPQSAGANPGPACYGRGGTEPTVTDADLVLGLLNPDFFAGGDFDLDVNAAEAAVERVADPLGMSVIEAALAIRTIVDEKMAGATRVVSVEQGFDPRNFSLVAYGGAGPLHAVEIADVMNMASVIVPNHPGLTSSLGLLLADVRHTFERSLVVTAPELDAADVEAAFEDLEAEAARALDDEDVDAANRSLHRSFDVRYEGQEHTLNVAADAPVDASAVERATERFETEHERVYGFRDETSDAEFVGARLTAVGHVEEPNLTMTDSHRTGSLADVREESSIVVEGPREVTAGRYRWGDVVPGDELAGPAVIEQPNSTVWIPAGYTGAVDDYKNVVITEVEG